MTNDEQTKLMKDVSLIRQDVDSILHGNGRAGVRKIADAVFGHRDAPQEPGLMIRVQNVERAQQKEVAERKEQRTLQRGIAIGLSVVLLDTVGVVDLVRAWFGF